MDIQQTDFPKIQRYNVVNPFLMDIQQTDFPKIQRYNVVNPFL